MSASNHGPGLNNLDHAALLNQFNENQYKYDNQNFNAETNTSTLVQNS